MEVKAFIIHLERATDRRPQVEQLIDQCPLPTEVITAVDGAQVSDAEADALYRPALHEPWYPFPLRRAEVACFSSHRKCWQTIVGKRLDAGLILEDDVELDLAQFEPALKLAIETLQPDSYVRFPEKRRELASATIAETATHRLIVPKVTGVGMIGQLVGREAAVKLLESTQQFDRPVDTTLQMTWLTGVQPTSVYPGGITERSAELGGSRIGSRKTWSEIIQREILRPIYRYRVARCARRHAA